MPSGDIAWRTVGPRAAARAADVPAQSALAQSGGANLSAFLHRAAQRAEPVLLLVNDPQRATRTTEALRQIAAARDRERRNVCFRVLVATGTHQFDVDQRQRFEEATLTGADLRIDQFAWHDVRKPDELTSLAGARLHRLLGEHGFLLPIGSVEPHYFAGLTGAHKTLTIGCMGRDDIERNHEGALHPNSDVLQLAGNPVYDRIVPVIRQILDGRHVCAINQLVVNHTVASVAVGDPLDTLDALLPQVREAFVHAVDEPVDVLELCVPPPLGDSLYQADKALKNNHTAVRDGGAILLVAECGDGVGPDHFLGLLREAPDYESAVQIVRNRGYRLGDHKAVKIRHLTDRKQRGVRVAIVSERLSADDLEGTGLPVFQNCSAALAWLRESARGPLLRGLRVEDAGNLCAQCRVR